MSVEERATYQVTCDAHHGACLNYNDHDWHERRTDAAAAWHDSGGVTTLTGNHYCARHVDWESAA